MQWLTRGKLAHLVYLRQRGTFGRLPGSIEAGEHQGLIEEGVETYTDADDEEQGGEPSASDSPSRIAGNESAPRIVPSHLGRDEEVGGWRSQD